MTSDNSYSRHVYKQIFEALTQAQDAAVEGLRTLDLPAELPADPAALCEEGDPELVLLVSYACFCDLALRDLQDGSLADCKDTYETFRSEVYPVIQQRGEAGA